MRNASPVVPVPMGADGETAVAWRRPINRTAPRRAVMVVVEGEGEQASWEIDRSMVVGRDSSCEMSVNDDAVSRRHARVTCLPPAKGHPAMRVVVEDLHSTNGTFVNDEPVRGPRELVEHDRVRVGHTVLVFILRDVLELAAERRLRDMATRDSLTRLLNRGAFDTALAREVDRARRYGRPLALLLLDIDHFKKVNDTYGHIAGDRVLKAVATELGAYLRTCDHLARYGGEELVVILPETAPDGAWRTGERLREGVERVRVLSDEHRIGVTVSVGCASLGLRHADGIALVADADAALYRAKQGGRNRTEISQNPSDP